MKRILLISLLLILCLAAIAVAEEAEDTAEATTTTEATTASSGEEEAMDASAEREIKVMHGKGAAMRVLQLRRALLQQVVSGEEIVAYLSEKGESVPELTAIIDELVILEGETKSLNVKAEGVVKEFVNIKRDAHQLTKEFRMSVKPLIIGEDRKTLHDRIKAAMDSNTELANLKKEIEALRQQTNQERVQQTFAKLGITDPALLERLQAGTITQEEVRAALKKQFSGLSAEEKNAARMRVKEAHDKERTKRMLLKEEMKAKHLIVKKDRLQKRWTKLAPEKRLLAKKRFDETLATLDRAVLMKARMRDARADVKMMKDKFKDKNDNEEVE